MSRVRSRDETVMLGSRGMIVGLPGRGAGATMPGFGAKVPRGNEGAEPLIDPPFLWRFTEKRRSFVADRMKYSCFRLI